MNKLTYGLVSTGLVAAASSLPAGETRNGTPPLITHYLIHKAPQVGPNLYGLDGLGNVLLVEGCAYHVKTRLHLSDKPGTKPEQQAIPSTITPVLEADGTRACHRTLKARSARVYAEGDKLFRLRDHPFVIPIRPDGCEVITAGRYDPHTGRWSIDDPTQTVAVTWHDGTANCHKHLATR